FDLDTRVFVPERQLPAFGRCFAGVTPPPCHLRADSVLEPKFGRIQLAGADIAVALGGFTARMEGGWAADRLLPRSTRQLLSAENLGHIPVSDQKFNNLASGKHVPISPGELFVARDTVEWGLGVDYRWHGWTPVLQVMQTFVLDNDLELLLNDVDTRLFG